MINRNQNSEVKLKSKRENVIMRQLFENNEFLIKNWNKTMENTYKIPKNSLYRLTNGLVTQKLIIKTDNKPKRFVFDVKIKDLLKIIEENDLTPLDKLDIQTEGLSIRSIIDRFVDAKILEKVVIDFQIYLKIIY